MIGETMVPNRGDRQGDAVVAVSRRGAALGARIRNALGPAAELHIDRRFASEVSGPAALYDRPLRPLISRLFAERRRLALVMPAGAAVRLIADGVSDKRADPAVVCVDDAGRFAVSLLSGHIGGADLFAARIAAAIGATPVVTSASHALDVPALDTLGSERGWRIEADKTALTRAAAAAVNGDPVGVYQDAGERQWQKSLPPNIRVCASPEELASFSAALLISDRADAAASIGADAPQALVIYRPRTLAVGVGCRRGASIDELDALLRRAFAANGLSPASVRCVATADIKRDEPALRRLAERLDAPLWCYAADALNAMPGPSGPSAARRLVGVDAVCEPAALLAAAGEGGGEIIVPKIKSKSATIAVARIRTMV